MNFFCNKNWKCYPCHKGITEINCLFCFCPFYYKKDCEGNPKFITIDNYTIKDCSDCIFPHLEENYQKIINMLKKNVKELI